MGETVPLFAEKEKAEQQTRQKNWCKERFASMEAGLNGLASSFFHQYRSGALQALIAKGFPTHKEEAWKYSDLSLMTKPVFADVGRVLPQEKEVQAVLDAFDLPGHRMVFSQGKLLPEFSRLPDGLRVFSLSELARDEEALLKEFWNGEQSEQEFVQLLNTSFVQGGAILDVPAHLNIDKPIVVYHLSNFADVDFAEHSFFGVRLGEGAEAKIIEMHECIGHKESPHARLLSNPLTDLRLARGAQLKHARILHGSFGHTGLTRTQGGIAASAQCDTFVYSSGSDFVRNEIELRFCGSNARAGLFGLSAMKGKEQVDNTTTLHHALPHCESVELFKGVYAGESKGAFTGTIIVSKDAQKTNAIQNNQSLLLSRDAESNTRPTLKIWADDVKCTHGATVGELDENALFYLRSRGVPEQEAQKLLVQAFLGEALSNIDYSDELKEQILQHALSRIS